VSLPFPDTKQRVSIQARIPVELPGTIFRHKQTGQLVGILSCDEGQWCELVSPSAARTEHHLTDVLKNHSKASKANLSVLSKVETDCRGELPISRRTCRVRVSELVQALQQARMEVVS
jgi:hypothetical protein